MKRLNSLLPSDSDPHPPDLPDLCPVEQMRLSLQQPTALWHAGRRKDMLLSSFLTTKIAVSQKRVWTSTSACHMPFQPVQNVRYDGSLFPEHSGRICLFLHQISDHPEESLQCGVSKGHGNVLLAHISPANPKMSILVLKTRSHVLRLTVSCQATCTLRLCACPLLGWKWNNINPTNMPKNTLLFTVKYHEHKASHL